MIAFLCYEHWKFIFDSVIYHLYCHKIQIIGEFNALNKYLILLKVLLKSYYSEGHS